MAGLAEAVTRGVDALCARCPEIVAVALVGSRARGDAQAGSDVDLIVLTPDRGRMLGSDDWYADFDPAARLVRSGIFGVVEERRLQLSSGLVVEVGVALPDWADVDPVDAGTASVVRDGLVPLWDPSGLLARLSDVCVRGKIKGAETGSLTVFAAGFVRPLTLRCRCYPVAPPLWISHRLFLCLQHNFDRKLSYPGRRFIACSPPRRRPSSTPSTRSPRRTPTTCPTGCC